MLNIQHFDETKINWQPLPGPDGSPADHLGCSILHIDDEAKIVDILFKFSANEKIVNHRHTSDFNTFVVKGELHIYDLEGNTKEVRYPGTYTAGIANDEPHKLNAAFNLNRFISGDLVDEHGAAAVAH